MGRSLKKGPFVEPHLLEKIDKMNASGVKKPVKTWSRRSMVTPDFVGHTFLVHNGKIFQSVFVTSASFHLPEFLRNTGRTPQR